MRMMDTRQSVSSKKQRQVEHMTGRFLQWRLPDDFSPDGGISFKPTFNENTAFPMKAEPVGTNLLNAEQAKAMLLFMMEGMPE